MTKKRVIIQLFINILDILLLNYCYYYEIIIMTFLSQYVGYVILLFD